MLALWATPCGAQSPKLEDIRVSFASFGVIYYPHFIAKELGFYQDEGLNIEIIAMPGGLATQALVAGDLHFSTSSGSSLNASLRGIKLKVVYVNLDRPLYRLWSWRQEIRKVTDLRGKGIGVASRGDTMEGAANLLLRKHGMDPMRDVVWIALGTGGRLHFSADAERRFGRARFLRFPSAADARPSGARSRQHRQGNQNALHRFGDLGRAARQAPGFAAALSARDGQGTRVS